MQRCDLAHRGVTTWAGNAFESLAIRWTSALLRQSPLSTPLESQVPTSVTPCRQATWHAGTGSAHDILLTMKELSWTQFDQAVAVLAERLATRPTTGIYGVPRGGLCLAVALSHAMQQPLLSEPNPKALIVDDVYESGRTLQALQARFPHAGFAVWVSKRPPLWWHAAEVTDQAEWLLFPWENAAQARADEQAYRASRQVSP